MEESFGEAVKKRKIRMSSKRYVKAWQAVSQKWDRWKRGREVSPQGICKEYKPSMQRLVDEGEFE
jgi:hypothetical protein